MPWLHGGTSEREQGWVLHSHLKGKGFVAHVMSM